MFLDDEKSVLDFGLRNNVLINNGANTTRKRIAQSGVSGDAKSALPSEKYLAKLLGSGCGAGLRFGILAEVREEIDAGGFGCTIMWIVLDCEPNKEESEIGLSCL